MQKYKYAIWSFCGLLLLSITACKKNFLNVVPKGESVLQTWSDYNLLMNGSNFYVIGGGSTAEFSAFTVMGDEVAADAYKYSAGTVPYTQAMSMFQWQANIFPLNNPVGSYTQINTPSFVTPLASKIYIASM